MPAPPHNETGHTWHHPALVLFRITKLGVAQIAGDGYESDMPGFADILSDQQILEVLAYIKSTWSDHIITKHNKRHGCVTSAEFKKTQTAKLVGAISPDSIILPCTRLRGHVPR